MLWKHFKQGKRPGGRKAPSTVQPTWHRYTLADACNPTICRVQKHIIMCGRTLYSHKQSLNTIYPVVNEILPNYPRYYISPRWRNRHLQRAIFLLYRIQEYFIVSKTREIKCDCCQIKHTHTRSPTPHPPRTHAHIHAHTQYITSVHICHWLNIIHELWYSI